jgi:hypothetical protein
MRGKRKNLKTILVYLSRMMLGAMKGVAYIDDLYFAHVPVVVINSVLSVDDTAILLTWLFH